MGFFLFNFLVWFFFLKYFFTLLLSKGAKKDVWKQEGINFRVPQSMAYAPGIFLAHIIFTAGLFSVVLKAKTGEQ